MSEQLFAVHHAAVFIFELRDDLFVFTSTTSPEER